jgi:hypothetical protein
MGLDHIRSEIEHMRTQVGRQRGEIRQLQRAGIPAAAAEDHFEQSQVAAIVRGAGHCGRSNRNGN